jgi:hypothetical protein
MNIILLNSVVPASDYNKTTQPKKKWTYLKLSTTQTSKKMQPIPFTHLFKSSRHVSSDKFAHPQDHFWLYIQLLVQCTDSPADRWRSWDVCTVTQTSSTQSSVTSMTTNLYTTVNCHDRLICQTQDTLTNMFWYPPAYHNSDHRYNHCLNE